MISTISGNAQLALIDAAVQAHVRRFAPAEFEGLPSLRPVPDALDRGRGAALERLHQYQARGMQYCVFICGIFYERFAPGGMIASNIGRGSGISGEGDYIMDIRRMKAQIPHGSNGRPASVCITSVQDVGRFVAAAVGMPRWPTEIRMCGERMDFSSLVRMAELMRGKHFPVDCSHCPLFLSLSLPSPFLFMFFLFLFFFLSFSFFLLSLGALTKADAGRAFDRTNHNVETLSSSLHQARISQEIQGQLRVISLIASAEGRYDFPDAHFSQMVGIVPRRFQDWLQMAWTGQTQSPT